MTAGSTITAVCSDAVSAVWSYRSVTRPGYRGYSQLDRIKSGSCDAAFVTYVDFGGTAWGCEGANDPRGYDQRPRNKHVSPYRSSRSGRRSNTASSYRQGFHGTDDQA